MNIVSFETSDWIDEAAEILAGAGIAGFSVTARLVDCADEALVERLRMSGAFGESGLSELSRRLAAGRSRVAVDFASASVGHGSGEQRPLNSDLQALRFFLVLLDELWATIRAPEGVLYHLLAVYPNYRELNGLGWRQPVVLVHASPARKRMLRLLLRIDKALGAPSAVHREA